MDQSLGSFTAFRDLTIIIKWNVIFMSILFFKKTLHLEIKQKHERLEMGHLQKSEKDVRKKYPK